MTPKEKAIELIGSPVTKQAIYNALELADKQWEAFDKSFIADPEKPALSELLWSDEWEYWQKVKMELENQLKQAI